MASTARSAVPAAGLIARLRERLRAAEAAAGLGDDARTFALGIPAIDRVLGGGLNSGALHEVVAAHEPALAAATGFALGLAMRRQSGCASANMVRDMSFALPRCALASGGKGETGSILWIAEDLSLAESGAPYGPGLDQAGIAPERLITVTAAHAHDVLWAMEEALRCRAVGTVIGELRARTIDHVASRRLALAAAAGGTLGLLLRPASDDDASTAATRWIVGAAPSARGERWSVGPPRLALRLARNRRGHIGTWIVEWDSVEQRFVLAAHSEPVARQASDRPHQAAMA